jgi:metallophosphoesterase superfamily enzyme
MPRAPQAAAPVVELVPGVSALAPGLLWLHGAKVLVAADVHFAYEDVIGAALPAWSIAESVSTLLIAAQRMQAREIVLLGDVIHGARMSEGAASAVREALDTLRGTAQLTLVAGNHEGRTRGAAVLGDTVELAARDGWLLLHGDKPLCHPELVEGRCIIGHLHPSLPLGGGVSAPAFLASHDLIVVPALTPYSAGLSVLSDACLRALQTFGVESRRELDVVVAERELLYPFGTLSRLRGVLTAPRAARKGVRR